MNKLIILIAALCTLASSQFANSRYQNQASFQSIPPTQYRQHTQNPTQYRQNTQNPTQYLQNSQNPTQYRQNIQDINSQTFGSSASSRFGYRGTFTTAAPVRYQNNPFASQYQQQPKQQPLQLPAKTQGQCREKNERSPIPGSCDSYIECINGTAEEKFCPDGLRFNPNVNFNVYPCQYPNEVPCLERSSLQPAEPTEDCPHQFGYFKLGDARNCSSFRNCVNGVGHDFNCPEGLAFSSETYRCEWPDEVADCDAEAFLGFRCPPVPESRELGPPAGYRTYRSDANCQKYFLCIEGRPRILSCGGDSGFDELTGTCVSADQVTSCPPQLREQAARAREDEKQRQALELSYSSRTQQQKRRF